MSSTTKRIVRENKKLLGFLAWFVSLYLILNTAYGLWVEWYAPGPDPLTVIVTKHTRLLLELAYSDLSVHVSPDTSYVGLLKTNRVVVNVFEGCNSLNVIIVFMVFVIAFSGWSIRALKFILVSSLIIYLANLFRIALLFWIADEFPHRMYFYHKYLFTATIYGVVFLLWYYWIKATTRDTRASTD